MSTIASNAEGRKTLLLATAVGAGIVGVGIGGGVVYLFIKQKFQDILRTQQSFSQQLRSIHEEIHQIKSQKSPSTVKDDGSLGVKGNESHIHTRGKPVGRLRKTVKFANGYETADDDEYITASSSSSEEDEGHLSKRDRGSIKHKLPNGHVDMGGGGDAAVLLPLGNASTAFFKSVDALFEGDLQAQDEAYAKLKLNERKWSGSDSVSGEYFWRLAKAIHFKATAAGNNKKFELKRDLTFQAFEIAEKALRLNISSSADVHKWYAITLGSKGDFLPIKEKIKNGYTFKEHIDKAIALRPSDSTLHYLMGRFCFEVSQLSWIERKLAATIFSEPPSSSFQESLDYFLTAEKIGKPFKENRLCIAKCYIGLKDYAEAATWLQRGASLAVLTPTDKAAQVEISTLLPKYQGYLDE